ncbi:MAG: fructose-bisphosphatase class II [Planctomycetota bacterium]
MTNHPTTPPDELDTHRGLRFGVLDLIRCTEQTAILMSIAEGKGINAEILGVYATLSMAGYLRESTYRAHLGIFDEIYDREGEEHNEDEVDGENEGEHQESDDGAKTRTRPRNKTTPSVKILRALERVAARYRGDPNKDQDLELEFCCAPIDGRRALSAGQTGGTVSALAFAAHDKDRPVLAPPRETATSPPPTDGSRPRGRTSHADQSPPWLVLAGSAECASRLGGVEQIQDFLRKAARKAVRSPDDALVENFVNVIFDEAGSRSSSSRLPIQIERALAMLDHPKWYTKWNRQKSPPCKKRLFTGSSLAVNLAAMFDSRGFDCALSITRHIHAVQASIAARTLGGFIVAVPLRRSDHQTASPNNKPLCVESDDIWTHTQFVRSTDAALIVSGISENVVLSPVRIRGDQAWVNTLSLSARTKSFRKLEHRITLSGPSATRFACFDEKVLDRLDAGAELPNATWKKASDWYETFEDMLNPHLP